MKTTLLLAAAALSLVACAAESASNSETSEAAATAGDTLISVPITVNVATDLSEMRCRILQGSWISFRFQFHDYMAYGADDLDTCNEKLNALEATPVQSARIMSDHTGDLTVFTLQIGGFAFTSRNPTDIGGLVVTQTSNVEATFTNPRCNLSKGFSTLSVDFGGNTFEQTLPFDGCNAAATGIVQGRHAGQMTVSTYESHTTKELVLDNGTLQLSADIPVHE